MSDRFLGLTKSQWLALLAALFLALVVLQTYLIVQVGHTAAQGAESHQALCVLKRDYAQRLRSSQAYLRLTREQRVAKYGESLGTIPDQTIQSSIKALQANIDSLSDLNCGG